MQTMIREVRKKKPVAGKAAKQSSQPQNLIRKVKILCLQKDSDTFQSCKQSDNNFYTYIQMVEKKAYELYEKRGREHGRDQDDWFEAQKLVEDELHR